ncbi:MAG: hypothetical protein ABSB69_20950, partial [Solirubrobacteraceae bacterium]
APAMPTYFERQLRALEELDCPIDPALFSELAAAETRLSDRPPSRNDTWEHHMAGGLTASITARMGYSKKAGFEFLREVVTRHRQAWASRHLERYLKGRWEHELRRVGDAYHRHVANKGKSPTPMQFAALGEQAANHWFAGDLAQLASALALPAPEPQQYRRLMPADCGAFVAAVSSLLEVPHRRLTWGNDEREKSRADMAHRAPEIVQIWEATDEKPQANRPDGRKTASMLRSGPIATPAGPSISPDRTSTASIRR